MTDRAHAAPHNAGSAARHSTTVHAQGVFGSLIPEIRRAIAAEGYVTPTPIQEQCIPHLLEGRDLMGIAQTGTGKTAAFALPLLQKLSGEQKRTAPGTPRALILAPTRELAAQIGDSMGAYGRFLRLRHAVVFGGVSQTRQVDALGRGIDILVATPGRLLDLMGQGYIHLESVEVFILDEVDRMLDMGFIPDIRRVLAHLPSDRQTLFFSATMPPDIVELAGTMVRNPVRVSVSPEQPAVELISQKVLFVDKGNKDALLVSLLGDPGISKALVFTRMKHTANKVVKKLAAHGIQGAAIHGNKSQSVRTKSLDDFRQGRCRVLVATDLAARGLDVDGITHVINYDLPVEAETYVHRIGRTARAGAAGDAISFCTAEEKASLRDIERLLGESVPAEIEHGFHCEEAFRSNRPPVVEPARDRLRTAGSSGRRTFHRGGGRPARTR
jgi:ATP-dependent RNA helicase RhlE